jgi:predicted O-methyltransferase YrrM
LPPLDAIALYGFLARTNPRTYLEIGSGNSTRFAARAIADHGLRTRIVSIDPEPRAGIDALCHEVVRRPFEDIEPERFSELTSEDLVFLDGSHRSFQGSDVTVFFLELLPVLPRGVIWGVHDVFLPADYPAHWIDRWYNEQYLLAAWLLGGGGGDDILLPCSHFVSQPPLLARLDRLWTLPALVNAPRFGSSFWLQRSAH